MNPLTEAQKGYLAALIDGEGSICLGRSARNTDSGYSYFADVSVSNTKRDLLVWCRAVTGIGNIPNPQTPVNSPRANPGYSWQLRSYEIVPFLEVITPYLVIKQTQAELMLEFFEKCLSKRYERWHNPIPEDVIVLRNVIYEELKELNKRGT